jgi:hypothetical protein
MKSLLITLIVSLTTPSYQIFAQSHYGSGFKSSSSFDSDAEKKQIEFEQKRAAEEARIRAEAAERERRQAELERQLEQQKREAEIKSQQRSSSYGGGQDIKVNAYGAGVNADQYGRSHVYRTQDGKRLDAIQQEGVKRDGYGYGVHIDQYGRPVRDSQP